MMHTTAHSRSKSVLWYCVVYLVHEGGVCKICSEARGTKRGWEGVGGGGRGWERGET